MEMLSAILHSLTAALGGTAKLSGGNPWQVQGCMQVQAGVVVHARRFWCIRAGAARVMLFDRSTNPVGIYEAQHGRRCCD